MMLARSPRLVSAIRPHRRYKSSLSKDDLATLLSKPTWSLKSLLQSSTSTTTNGSSPSNTSSEITPAQLHHLLRLSALPSPATPAEETSMLRTLSSQIHFVREVQAVDTTGVEPLRALRDETSAAIKESTIGLEQMREFLEKEEVVGKNRRIRRKKDVSPSSREGKRGEFGEKGWDPLELAQEKRGRYFVVKREKKGKEQKAVADRGSGEAPPD